ncbi:MAG TPA: ABC transporter permease [Chloroflexi bacterium]|nr:ABC transporter permease [Chloroflexota bacterium]
MEKGSKRKMKIIWRGNGLALLPFTLALTIFIWYLIVWIGDLEPFILPTPGLIMARFIRTLQDGSLFRHFGITLFEVISGLILGATVATGTGYLLAKSPHLERILSPYIVASQSVPIVAIAPLLIIWFGPGMLSKVLTCALIVYFPILINTVVGVRAVPEDLYDLMRSLQAGRWQIFSKLEVPSALPVLLGGLRIGATLAVIGAVVGEFVGSDRGLGFLINVGRGQYDIALVFVAVFSLVFMALVLYGLVVLIERRLLAWQQRPKEESLMTMENEV